MENAGCILWRLRPQDPENHETATPVEVCVLQAVIADVDCKLDVLKPYNRRTLQLPN